jgi:hypothetical protein
MGEGLSIAEMAGIGNISFINPLANPAWHRFALSNGQGGMPIK